MTDGEFQTQLLSLSPKIQASLAQPGGDLVKPTLSSLAMTATSMSDLDTALAALTADPVKLAAFENQVATQVAAAPVATQPQAVPPKQQAAAAPNASPWMPPTGQTWVGPTVSLAVIAGFFVMLGILLYLEMHRSSVAAASVEAQTAALEEAVKAADSANAEKLAADNKLSELKAAKSPDATAIKAADDDATKKDAAATAAAAKLATAKAAAATPAASNNTPTGLQNVLFTLLGALGAAFTQVVNYWLGSSKGSADKTTFLANSVPLQLQNQSNTTSSSTTSPVQGPNQGPTGAPSP